jgi:peptidoglycan/xylan/chitin deacetylase (PgdA/CDA1 family)
MYHSISDGSGPTCIAPGVFRQQMEMLEDSGYRVVSLLDLLAWMREGADLPDRCAALTFDDGFLDFATAAFPELARRGWTATVFLPVGHVGGTNRWESAGNSSAARRLLDWSAVLELATAGINFGAHGVTHRDLRLLRGDELRDEVVRPKREIEDRLSRAAVSFAAPYGRTDARVDRLIRQHYRQAVGTELALARKQSNPYAIPRIEMWYFRSAGRWKRLLEGDARSFLLVKRLLRRVRGIIPKPAGGPIAVSDVNPPRAG